MTSVEVREAVDRDRPGILQVHERAFPTSLEARLVERLWAANAVVASVVAVEDDLVIGHALFSGARLEVPSGEVTVGALGPVGVLPERQGRGVGGKLIRFGLDACRDAGMPGVIVLGHPDYYPRFGFVRADTWSIRCEFDAPPEAFMIAWFAAPVRGPGLAKYNAEFSRP